MASKRVALVRVDEDYIDMLMSPYDKLSPKQQNRDILMSLPKLPYNANAPFGIVRSQSCRLSSCESKKHAKKSLLFQKLNSYKAFIKSLFRKTVCSTDKFSIASNANNVTELNKPKCKHFETAKGKSFEIQQHNVSKANSSGSSSFSSTFSINLNVNSEMEEGSVAEAIAHCNESQKLDGSTSNKDSSA